MKRFFSEENVKIVVVMNLISYSFFVFVFVLNAVCVCVLEFYFSHPAAFSRVLQKFE